MVIIGIPLAGYIVFVGGGAWRIKNHMDIVILVHL